MIFTSTVWANNRDFSIDFTPLLDIANIYRYKKNIHHEWHILVLDGYEHYSELRDQLANLNCHLIDASELYREIFDKHRVIYDIYVANGGHKFHFNNTLRLLVTSHYFNNADFLHTDIDLIVNDEPQHIVGNSSLYMGSTCFVYVKNTDFARLYNDMLCDYANNAHYFHEQAKKLIENQAALNPWNIFGQTFLDEEGLFYIFLHKNGYDWTSNVNNEYIHIPFMSGMFSYIEPTYQRMSMLKVQHNKYKHEGYRHYMNDKPMAYMHYQYNFRLILAFYLLQKHLQIPNDKLYCPDIQIETLMDKNLALSYNARANQQSLYRKNNYINNFVPDLLLGKIFTTLEYASINLDGFKPWLYRNILSLEDRGLGEVLNNNFWYSKEVFV